MELPPHVNAKIDRSGDCWTWTGSRRDGRYGQVQVNYKNWLVHRLMWTVVNGPVPAGMFVCHTCDNLVCCNPDHLFLGTPADNSADMVQKGRSLAGDLNPSRTRIDRMRRGEGHSSAKLTDAEVEAIRTAYAAGGASLRSLAHEYGVSHVQIDRVVKRLQRL